MIENPKANSCFPPMSSHALAHLSSVSRASTALVIELKPNPDELLEAFLVKKEYSAGLMLVQSVLL